MRSAARRDLQVAGAQSRGKLRTLLGDQLMREPVLK
jgi:hypothetical protein